MKTRIQASSPAVARRWEVAKLVLVACAVVGAAGFGWDWQQRRAMEERVAFWRDDAVNCARNHAHAEAEKTWIWLMTAFPGSHQMAAVHIEYARFCLDSLGQVARAARFVERQRTYYPFNIATLEGWALEDEIDRAADHGSPYPAGEVWGAFIAARRRAEVESSTDGLADLRLVLARYPLSSLVPDILLSAGNAALERCGSRSLARAYFRELRSRFPDHPLLARIPPADRLIGEDETVDDLRRRRAQSATS